MPFRITKRLDLSYLGDTWEGCYLEFEALTVKDTKQLAEMQISKDATQEEQMQASEKVLALLKDKFVSGQAMDGADRVAVKKTDIEDMPLEIIPKALEVLVGGDQKN